MSAACRFLDNAAHVDNFPVFSPCRNRTQIMEQSGTMESFNTGLSGILVQRALNFSCWRIRPPCLHIIDWTKPLRGINRGALS